MTEQIKLKQLNTRVAKIGHKIEDVDKTMSQLKREKADLANQLNQARQEIKRLTDRGLILSEHAILRYLERAHEINMDRVRDAILTDELKAMVGSMGGEGKFPINAPGFRAVVKNNVITTIVKG